MMKTVFTEPTIKVMDLSPWNNVMDELILSSLNSGKDSAFIVDDTRYGGYYTWKGKAH